MTTPALLGMQLEPAFANYEPWALDAATQLLAYDPKASAVVRVEFELGSRIVIFYQTDLGYHARRSPPVRTFVIPEWVAPEKREPSLIEACAARLIDQDDEPSWLGENQHVNRLHYWRDKAIQVARRLRGED